jgi:lipoprotein NlpD
MKGFSMSGLRRHLASVLTVALAGAVLAGCGSKAINRAPVEDRGAATAPSKPAATSPVPAAPETPAPVVKPLPGAENTGNAGYYTVKPGDTLIRIGLDHGQGAKDIARWNGIENPNRIEVGQVLRIEPPAASAAVTKPVVAASANPVATPAVRPASADKPVTAASVPAVSAQAPVSAAMGDDEISWIWPTGGVVLTGFDEVKNKGLDIAGAAGEPVLAAADGRVVYVGAGLRGYGNLIILKHNNTYLTAYAHNQALVVKEDQSVRKGQKIAEMGSSDADRVKLHFEVRRQGKPVDPAKYLPAR